MKTIRALEIRVINAITFTMVITTSWLGLKSSVGAGAITGCVPTKIPATSSEIWQLLTLSLQPHLHIENQPAQRPFTPDGGVVKPRELPRRPLGHVDGESLHEAQRHVDLIAREGELKVPEREHNVLGRKDAGHLSRFDLQRDDGVEVFEFVGGDGAGD